MLQRQERKAYIRGFFYQYSSNGLLGILVGVGGERGHIERMPLRRRGLEFTIKSPRTNEKKTVGEAY